MNRGCEGSAQTDKIVNKLRLKCVSQIGLSKESESNRNLASTSREEVLRLFPAHPQSPPAKIDALGCATIDDSRSSLIMTFGNPAAILDVELVLRLGDLVAFAKYVN